MTQSKIIWTKTDEAPALATYSLLPIIRAYTSGTGVEIETSDISLVGRIVANFPDNLSDDQKIPNHLSELGQLVKCPEANIIKLPNISASIPQLQGAIEELRDKGYDIPEFPEDPENDAEKVLRERFSVCLGSAVNPVLREGNADRRPAVSVKRFAQKQPHKMMKPWPESGSKSRVAHMTGKDFFESEESTTVNAATFITAVSTTSSCWRATFSFSTVVFPSPATNSILTSVALSMVVDLSLSKKSFPSMWATRALDPDSGQGFIIL